jgi:prepilin-type N-terminal cleavage/methylation domain-containing protein
MTYTKSTLSRRCGFTLVELLVVISIIAVLASLGFAGFNMAIQKAKKTSAKAAISSLVQACNDYYEDESQLPLNEGATADQERLSDNELMSILVGLESAREENPTGTSYFKYKKASGKGQTKYDGLDRNKSRAQLYGPWKNRQENDRFYRLMMDYDFDEEIDEPSNMGNETQFGQRVLVYHLGKDGEAGPGKNQDNVYSYKER